jgi:hypothetical protein
MDKDCSRGVGPVWADQLLHAIKAHRENCQERLPVRFSYPPTRQSRIRGDLSLIKSLLAVISICKLCKHFIYILFMLSLHVDVPIFPK